MIFLLDILSELFSSTIAGLPSIVVAIIPLIVGVIFGFLLKRVLKWTIIIGGIIVVLALFGFFGLNFAGLASFAASYAPLIYTYGVLLLGILPLGVGFIIGAIVGFIFG